MSDTTALPDASRFRGPRWERERAEMLFLAWRLGGSALRPLLETAMRTYAQRSPAFAEQLKLFVGRHSELGPLEDPQLVRMRPPSWTSNAIAQALASAWALGDPGFRPELEEAIRQYVRVEPAFKRALAGVQLYAH